MTSLKEAMGDKFAQYVEQGADAACFGLLCRHMTQEELLAVIGLCGDQAKAQRAAHESIINMHEVFRESRRKNWPAW